MPSRHWPPGPPAYVLKSSAGDELVTAIRRVLEGHVYVAKAIAQSVNEATDSAAKERRSHDRLADKPTARSPAITGRRTSGEGNCSHAQSVAQNRGVSQVPDYGHPQRFTRSLDWPATL